MSNKTKKKKVKERDIKKSDISNQISHYGYFIIVAVTVLLYLQIINFEFTGFEDDYLISKNITNLANIENLDDIFFKNSFLSEYSLGFYRPLQTASYMFNAIIAGDNPGFYYLTNLIIHSLTCCFVFLLFQKLNYKKGIALSVALLYAVHPLFVHAVVWLPSRGDLLLCLFAVLSFIFLIKYEENNNSKIYFVYHIIFFLFAGLSKETALLFPIVLSFWFFIVRRNPVFKKQCIIFIISWLIIISLCYFLRMMTVENILSKEDFGIIPFFNNLATVPEVIGKFIVPINIQVMPNFNALNTSIGLFTMTFIIIIAILKIRKTSNQNIRIIEKPEDSERNSTNLQLLFGLIWFSVLILPGLFYGRKFTDSDHLFNYQDHRNYLPMIGLVIVLIEIFNGYFTKIKSKKLTSTGLIIMLLFSSITYINSKNYKNSLCFFNTAIQENPENSGLYFIRAGLKKDIGDTEGALMDYSRTINLNPENADAFNNRASLRAMQGDYKSALNDLNKAITLNPGITESYFNRAEVNKTLGNLKDAVKDYSAIIKNNPDDFTPFNERGKLKMTMNELDSAIDDFSCAININQKNAESYYNRGTAYLKFGKYQKAVDDFEYSIKIKPDYTEAFLNKGIALYRMELINDACMNWQKALELGNTRALQMLELYCKKASTKRRQ